MPIAPQQYRCSWPDCPHTSAAPLYMCGKHFPMLPDNIRNWFIGTRPRTSAGDMTPNHRASRFAGIRWARNHPDPDLPPLPKGAVVRLRKPDLFSTAEPTLVQSCFLNGANKWQVFLANDEIAPAADLERVPDSEPLA